MDVVQHCSNKAIKQANQAWGAREGLGRNASPRRDCAFFWGWVKLAENRLGVTGALKLQSAEASRVLQWKHSLEQKTTQTRPGVADLLRAGALWAPQVDTCVCS